jgi:glycerol-3-phosphate acyltransferase PlsY
MSAELVARVISAVLVAYLLGSTPSALIVGKLVYDKDPRDYGSGNLGATNVWRTLGWKPGLSVLALDALKADLALLLITFLIVRGAPLWLKLIFLMVAICGHTFPVWLKHLKGGKGVATGAGGLFYLMPKVAWILLGIFLAMLMLTRMISAGSITIAIMFPFVTLWDTRGDYATFWVAAVMATLVVLMHRKNIVRIVTGKEATIW